MDILTQGVLGAVLAQSVAKKEDVKWATIIGFVAGLLADVDIFINSSTDPLLTLEFHRHFTHSIFFIPFGALITAGFFWFFVREKLSFKKIYIYSFLGFSMSGVLDACTSYGTYLFWPLINERISLNIISIVDPIFTLALLVCLVYVIRTKEITKAKIGLAFAMVYLSLGFIQQQRAQTAAEQLAESRGHTISQHVVKPTLGNLLLWRSVYLYKDNYYIDAVRVGGFSKNIFYKGSAIRKISLDKDLADVDKNSVLWNDIKRFNHFSDDYIVFSPINENVIGDLRYSMLPTSASPLWGIVINTDKPQQHVDYQFFRNSSQAARKEFLNMLLGRSNEK